MNETSFQLSSSLSIVPKAQRSYVLKASNLSVVLGVAQMATARTAN